MNGRQEAHVVRSRRGSPRSSVRECRGSREANHSGLRKRSAYLFWPTGGVLSRSAEASGSGQA
jgi:hypothetical protein